jgi:RNA-splicing ligase RtcB
MWKKMKVKKKFTISIKKIKIIFFFSKKLIPSNFDLKKFQYIVKNLSVHKKIICMPDLSFKLKNFIPTGVSVPSQNKIHPILLTSNNDSIGSLHVKSKHELKPRDITNIFLNIKKEIKIFRRQKNLFTSNEIKNFLKYGVKKIYKKWLFKKSEIERIEKSGSEKISSNINKIISIFSKRRPKSLPSYIPNYKILERGQKNIGVLDGTSHFIELFKVKKIIKKNYCKKLNVEKNDYFFLIHAGAGDVGRIFHHNILDKGENNINPNSKSGRIIKDAYSSAANFAFVNRLYIYKKIKDALFKMEKNISASIFSDLPHDYLDYDSKSKIFSHRKGVIKLYPGNKFKKTNIWVNTGSPYILPTFAGGDAYLMINKKGNKEANFTMSHGIGRIYTKQEASKVFKNSKSEKLFKKKIQIFRYNKDDINSQNPNAFKKTKDITDSLEKNNLGEKIAIFKSVGSLKA